MSVGATNYIFFNLMKAAACGGKNGNEKAPNLSSYSTSFFFSLATFKSIEAHFLFALRRCDIYNVLRKGEALEKKATSRILILYRILGKMILSR